MENFNHLNSKYYGYPIYGKEKTKSNSEFASTFWAMVVIVVFTIIAAFVC